MASRGRGEERERLAALRRYGILDTPPEPAFDRITAMAARLFDVPIALVVLIDAERQWFKSRHGLELPETARDISFCHHCIASDEVMVVEDASVDPRFADNPLVTGEPNITFYAAAPLKSSAGLNIGTLAIIDRRPRRLDDRDRHFLRELARVAMDEIEQRGTGALSLDDRDPRLRLVLEQVPAALWTCDRELRITSASGALLRDLAIVPDQVVGLEMAHFLPGEQGGRVLDLLRRAVAGEAASYHVSFGQFELQCHARPLRDASGACVGAIGIVFDITERDRIARRLAEAERLAALGTLSAGVAHEINNPLTYIFMNLSLAHQVVATARAEAASASPELVARLTRLDTMMADALVGANRVKSIVAELAILARTDAPVATARPGDPLQVIESAIAMAMTHIRHVARLERDLVPIPAVALADSRLAQVCLNLLGNAAHAIPEGHVADHVIRVATRQVGERVRLEISDSGGGIAPEHIERVFEPFFTTKDSGKGTGLGLSIVRGIVEQAGGSIAVEVTGGTTTFRLDLPIAEAEAEGETAAPSAPAAVKSGRILVVEDDPLVARVVHRVLRRTHDVVLVSSGREALTLLDSDPGFDVIISDVVMPDLSGVELYQHLRGSYPRLADRVIFMTAGTFSPATRRFLEETDRPVLTKPFDLDDLVRAVDAACAASAS